MCFAVIRFMAYGWVDTLLVDPAFHFTYLGFDWVRPWPRPLMYAHFVAMAVAALCMAVGRWPRLASAIFCLLFTYAELIEKAAYLNHYYLVSLLSALFALFPARLDRPVPRWVLWLVRAQVGVVYIYAGLAKLGPDWLLQAEPLKTWLQAYAHLPLVGGFLAADATAWVMSWGGAVFDLGVVFGLLWPPTRRAVYCVALVFHTTIWLLFPVGMFSWIMLASATIFFAPDWPRRFISRWRRPPVGEPIPIGAPRRVLAMIWLVVQIVVPLRHLAYPGDVNWTEQGFRFAWRVMLIEKTGQVEYRVCRDGANHCARVYPRSRMTPLQYRMLSTQPDMVQAYAHRLALEARAEGAPAVRVHADAFVSLNGRPAARFVDPAADLARYPRSWRHQPWILPLPSSP